MNVATRRNIKLRTVADKAQGRALNGRMMKTNDMNAGSELGGVRRERAREGWRGAAHGEGKYHVRST